MASARGSRCTSSPNELAPLAEHESCRPENEPEPEILLKPFVKSPHLCVQAHSQLHTALWAMKSALVPGPTAGSCLAEWASGAQRALLAGGQRARLELEARLGQTVSTAEAASEAAWASRRKAFGGMPERALTPPHHP